MSVTSGGGIGDGRWLACGQLEKNRSMLLQDSASAPMFCFPGRCNADTENL